MLSSEGTYDVKDEISTECNRPHKVDEEDQSVQSLCPVLPVIIDDSAHDREFPDGFRHLALCRLLKKEFDQIAILTLCNVFEAHNIGTKCNILFPVN